MATDTDRGKVVVFDDFLRKDIKKWADVVKTANIKAQ